MHASAHGTRTLLQTMGRRARARARARTPFLTPPWLTRARLRSSFAAQPYFVRWDNRKVSRYGPQIDDADTGTYGLKKVYVQSNPKEVYAPMRHP